MINLPMLLTNFFNSIFWRQAEWNALWNRFPAVCGRKSFNVYAMSLPSGTYRDADGIYSVRHFKQKPRWYDICSDDSGRPLIAIYDIEDDNQKTLVGKVHFNEHLFSSECRVFQPIFWD